MIKIKDFRTNWVWLYIETWAQLINKKKHFINETVKLVLALF